MNAPVIEALRLLGIIKKIYGHLNGANILIERHWYAKYQDIIGELTEARALILEHDIPLPEPREQATSISLKGIQVEVNSMIAAIDRSCKKIVDIAKDEIAAQFEEFDDLQLTELEKTFQRLMVMLAIPLIDILTSPTQQIHCGIRR